MSQRRYQPGPHELGQSFLVDRKYKSIFIEIAARPRLPVVELAAGDGALTLPLSRRVQRLTAVEIDPRRVRQLRRQLGDRATVVQEDLLRYRLPPTPHVVAANLPFHLTTAALRRLLAAPHWRKAILLTQWEVARRRAGVGGGSLLTATWSPWFEFELVTRVPARAFRPAPSVDGGIFTATRRIKPLVDRKGNYQRFVGAVFKAPGSTLREKAVRSGRFTRGQIDRWLRLNELSRSTLPRNLAADEWVSLWRASGRQPATPDQRRRRNPGSGLERETVER